MRRLDAGQALRGRDLVCFSNDWDGAPLSKTHLMRILARDNRILWVNSLGNRAPKASVHDLRRMAHKAAAALRGMREPEPNLHVLSPLAVPLPGSRAAAAVNRVALRLQVHRAMRALHFSRPIVWTFLPTAEWVATSLDAELLVYHCVDEFSAFSDAASRAIEDAERRLIGAAHLVIVSSARLLERKRALHPRTVLVRHGVDHAHFARALEPGTLVPDELAGLPRPLLGFFGLIEDWIDLELLERTAQAFPSGSLVIIGKERADTSRLRRLPNVHLLGERPYGRLPAYCKAFDVALMPFRVSELTLNANPLKVREYLAAGLPVVSTAIPEVEQLGLCLVGRTPEDFVARVREALLSPGPSRERSEAVREHSWEARVEEIRATVAALSVEGRPVRSP